MKKEDIKLNTFYYLEEFDWVIYVTDIRGNTVYGYYTVNNVITYNNTNGICTFSELVPTNKSFIVPNQNYYAI